MVLIKSFRSMLSIEYKLYDDWILSIIFNISISELYSQCVSFPIEYLSLVRNKHGKVSYIYFLLTKLHSLVISFYCGEINVYLASFLITILHFIELIC